MNLPEILEYFTQIPPPSPWIIEGIVRERQITALGAAFNTGKSPLLLDLALHTIHGLEWCGRQCQKRPVIYFDFETPDWAFGRSVINACTRLNLAYPEIPTQLVPLLCHGAKDNPYTKMLKDSDSPDPMPRLRLLSSLLAEHPNALVVCDPLQLFLQFDTNKQQDVTAVYKKLRDQLDNFPKAGIIGSFNLRKPSKYTEIPDLFSNPHGWLNEITGSMAVMNRCDIRAGLDRYSSAENTLVINGATRNETFQPLVIKSEILESATEQIEEAYAGFSQVDPDKLMVQQAFGDSVLQGYWNKLPYKFSYSSIVPTKILPNSTFYRVVNKAKSLKMLKLIDGEYIKMV